MKTRYSFLVSVCLSLFALMRASAAFPNAWQINDPSNTVSSTAFYTTNLLAAQSVGATNNGFRITVNARLVNDFGGAESQGFIYSAGSNRFSVFFDLDSDGNLLAVFPTNGGPNTTLTLTTNTIGARAYHTHDVVYVPGTKLATYSFDGLALRTWPGDGNTGAVGQVIWGANSESGQGQMNYRWVQFRVNNTNVALYDAGSSVTNRPIAPDPTLRGWTFSGLGADTATNAISPDIFWQPTIAVIGANPLLNTWTLPFTDPGAIVAARPVSLEAGQHFSLALKADATPAGWGDNSGGQVTFPPDATNLTALAGGDAHAIGLRADGTVIGWGNNSLGQTTIPVDATNIVSIAAGMNHNIALRADGTVLTWGDDSAITNAPPSATNVVAVAAGQLHNLVLRSNGTVVTWGFAPGQTNIPATVSNVIAIAAGNFNAVVRSNGTVIAWGDNTFNQTNVPGTANGIIAIAAGVSHCLALRTNGIIVAWGAGTNNTGVSPRFGQAIVPAAATNIVAIAAGDYHSIAMRADGTVLAWGAGTTVAASPHFGQSIVPTDLNTINLAVTTNGTVDPNTVGNYTLTYLATNSFGAVAITSRTVVVQFIYPTLNTQPASASNTLATLNGTVNPNGFSTFAWFEWGQGSRFDQKTTPVGVGNGTSPVAINASLAGLSPRLPYRCRVVASNAVGLVARGFDVAFGTPVIGVNGANPLTNIWGMPYVDPGIVSTGAPVAVAAGRAHTFALKQDGTVIGWGDNSSSQTNVPGGANNALAVSSGEDHGVVMRANGTVFAWGDNSFGQTTVPPTATNTVGISAGGFFNLALRRNGTLVGWGEDTFGQATAPVFVTNVAAISSGLRHSIALFTGGNIASWGYNGFGQTNVPPAATNVISIAAGSGHSVAARGDGTVLVWGLSSYFQTNLPATATNVIAVAAGLYHSLALRANGTVVAWGAGTNNTGFAPHYGQSVVPAAATNVVAIAAGYYHSLAMRADGSIIAWGAGTANTGIFPSLGQAIIPTTLNSLNLPLTLLGSVNTTLEGTYPLTYLATNPFGGSASPVGRNVIVTPAPGPSLLTSFIVLGNGSGQLTFSNGTLASYTVLASTNIGLPSSSWTVLGAPTLLSPGEYQFTDSQSTNFPQRFYQVRSP